MGDHAYRAPDAPLAHGEEAHEAECILRLVATPGPVEQPIVYDEAARTITGPSARECAAWTYRYFADHIASGHFYGGRIQWREGLHHIDVVFCPPPYLNEKGEAVRDAKLQRIELMTPERPPEEALQSQRAIEEDPRRA